MRTLRWLTDPHLHRLSPESRSRLLAQLAAGEKGPLIVTGDTSVAPRLVDDLVTLAEAAGGDCWFVLGNHDHYGGGIGQTRDLATGISGRHPRIRWLPPAGVVPLAEDLVLVGVDGWADGTHGDPLGTPLTLNDDRLIADLAAQHGRRARLRVKQILAQADAERLAVLLERAAPLAGHILVATHVPPFPQMLPQHGHLAGPDWLPLLVCGATGAVLRRFASDHPGHRLLVLAGHTHVPTDVEILPNLRARVGAPGVHPVEFPWSTRDPGREGVE